MKKSGKVTLKFIIRALGSAIGATGFIMYGAGYTKLGAVLIGIGGIIIIWG